MPLVISDDMLLAANLTEREALIEFSCRLFEAGKLDLWPAARMARLTRLEMEVELAKRQIPIYRPTTQQLEKEIASLEKFGDQA
ncbi:MAG TPA: UPF0175 family protein [Tepidisphaeraceae bacterium]|jgi:predicted HTH domain antitoxin|nr:UPF0175 family protein [Tepidisphaeraceae bacterium]